MTREFGHKLYASAILFSFLLSFVILDFILEKRNIQLAKERLHCQKFIACQKKEKQYSLLFYKSFRCSLSILIYTILLSKLNKLCTEEPVHNCYEKLSRRVLREWNYFGRQEERKSERDEEKQRNRQRVKEGIICNYVANNRNNFSLFNIRARAYKRPPAGRNSTGTEVRDFVVIYIWTSF